MEFGLLPEDIQNMKYMFASFSKIKQVVLFGSRVKGTYKEGSDIDIAICGDNLNLDDLFDISQ